MLVVRFQRVGRRNDPSFRVVVAERRSKPKSGGVETLGSYHPKTKSAVLNAERILYWLSQGAKASPTAHNLFAAKGIIKAKKMPVSKIKSVSDSVQTREVHEEKKENGALSVEAGEEKVTTTAT